MLVFDRWLCRFARRCSCRACCAGGCLVCGGDNVETIMSTIWVRARAREGHWWKVVFGARARTQRGCCCCILVLLECPRCEGVLYRCCYTCWCCVLTSLRVFVVEAVLSLLVFVWFFVSLFFFMFVSFFVCLFVSFCCHCCWCCCFVVVVVVVIFSSSFLWCCGCCDILVVLLMVFFTLLIDSCYSS